MPLQLATGIASWLRSRQDSKSGRVVDSAHLVSGYYADGFAALVFSMLGWTEARDTALQVSLQSSPAAEFDSFAQALLLEVAPESLRPEQQAAIRNRHLYDGPALVSNNWALFRALTRSLLGRASADYSLLDRQLPSGLFPDSPLGQATPVCYHAKICSVLALRALLRPEAGDIERLKRGLSALFALVSPQGLLVPYGRSRHTLFAYGSAYLALAIGACLLEDGRLTWAAARLLEYMRSFRDDDGHIPAVLNRNEWLRQDWDVYLTNPDYNAYAAACLLLAERLSPVRPAPIEPAPQVSELGPLLVLRSDSVYFACSVTGEFAPLVSPFFCDTRYAGMVPLLYDDGTKHRFWDQNYCWDGRDSTRKVLGEPRAHPLIPYHEHRGRRFWVRIYERTSWNFESGILRVVGVGRPEASTPVSGWQRYLAGLARQPVLQMHRREIRAELETQLQLQVKTGELTIRSKISGKLSLTRAEHREVLC